MRNERAKRAESLEAVTHTHTHTHTFIQVYRRIGGQSGERELKFKKDKKIETQKNCVCLRYKDGLRKLVCLFCVCDSS